MAAIQGRGGKVMVASATAAFVENWTLNIEDEALETTGLGSTSKSFIGRGLPGTTASITFRALDLSDTATLAFLTAAQANATGVTLLLYTSASKYFTSAASSAFVTSLTCEASVDGLVTGSADLQLSGVATYT